MKHLDYSTETEYYSFETNLDKQKRNNILTSSLGDKYTTDN